MGTALALVVKVMNAGESEEKEGEERDGKDLLSKDPFERPAGDPPAFRGTLVLRDCKELARRF